MKINTAAIYCRGEDIPYQVGMTAGYIYAHNLSLTGIYADQNGQDGLSKLADDCLKGGIDSVIVRNSYVIAGDIDTLRKMGEFLHTEIIGAEDFIYSSDNFNLDTLEYERPERQFSDSHKQALSNAVSETKSVKRDEGAYIGRTFYGYTRSGDQLAVNPETAETVKQIFELAKVGHSQADITKYLNEKEILTPGGGKNWNKVTVSKILRDSRYCGTVYAEPIIDQKTFDLVQDALGEKRSIQRFEEADPFAMARCGVCGHKLTYSRTKKIYKCDRHTGANPAGERLDHEPRISAAALEAEVMRQYREHMENFRNTNSPRKQTENNENAEKYVSEAIEAGTMILRLEDQYERGEIDQKTCLDEIEIVCREHADIWENYIAYLERLIQNVGVNTLSRIDPIMMRLKQMDQYDPEIGTWAITSLQLNEDGTVEVHFRGEK